MDKFANNGITEIHAKKNNLGRVVLLLCCAALATSTAAYAGSDTTFSAGVLKLTNFLSGSGGLLITLVAIIAAVVAGATGNMKTALTALGVAILASVGPTVAATFFTAVLA